MTAYGADCGLNITPDTLAFGEWGIGAETNELTLNLENTGTHAGTAEFSGVTWKDDGGSTIMRRTATHWSSTANEIYDDMTALSNGSTDLGNIDGGNAIDIFFKVVLAWTNNSNGFEGDVSQALTFSISC